MNPIAFMKDYGSDNGSRGRSPLWLVTNRTRRGGIPSLEGVNRTQISRQMR